MITHTLKHQHTTHTCAHEDCSEKSTQSRSVKGVAVPADKEQDKQRLLEEKVENIPLTNLMKQKDDKEGEKCDLVFYVAFRLRENMS